MRVFEATKSLAYSKARASSAIVELEKSFMRLHSKVNALVKADTCFWTSVLRFFVHEFCLVLSDLCYDLQANFFENTIPDLMVEKLSF